MWTRRREYETSGQFTELKWQICTACWQFRVMCCHPCLMLLLQCLALLLYCLQLFFLHHKTSLHFVIILWSLSAVSSVKTLSFVVGAVFLNIAKAFDMVNHTLLLSCLANLGFDPATCEWFCYYLRDRHQCTAIDENFFEEAVVTSGVPQGSVLGPSSSHCLWIACQLTLKGCQLSCSQMIPLCMSLATLQPKFQPSYHCLSLCSQMASLKWSASEHGKDEVYADPFLSSKILATPWDSTQWYQHSTGSELQISRCVNQRRSLLKPTHWPCPQQSCQGERTPLPTVLVPT